MPRMTGEQWELVKTDFEVRGLSLNSLAEKYPVDRSAISKRAKRECWQKGKLHSLIARKMALIKELVDIAVESHDLPAAYQFTIEDVIRERLEADGWLTKLNIAIAQKCLEFVSLVKTPKQLEILSRVHRNLRDVPIQTQPMAQPAAQYISPRETMAALVRQAQEIDVTETEI